MEVKVLKPYADSHEGVTRHVIADILQAEIDSGVYVVGEKMPSEAELCSRFKENRYTVRQALDLLVTTGVIRAHQGKGHYVCEKPLDIAYTITPGMRFSDVISRLGCKPGIRMIKQEIVIPPQPIAQHLLLLEHEHAYRLEILRFADDIPLSLNVTWLPERHFPDLLQRTESFHSLYELLGRHYDIQMQRLWSTFQSTYPNAQEALLLQVSPSMNLLHIESLMRDQHGRPVEFTSAKYRGDLCKVSIHF
ncbi:GntR family transcriptional regulator [Paenibacillus thalictri]|uniref:GntR family transcriptional regulator n=1 Tax=Paenibacillus thalictri TaxID=2527873 RepID=A0A4Q9DIL5_9BACL|nr:GntR family transcriptional regulator [Paenibacillus thalictri]TBL70520.1 GntR family transcriptional regulator [Paenibacillus thalictri]